MPTSVEFRQTILFAVVIVEASAKVRTGPSKDEQEDLSLPLWAGVLPLVTRPGMPEPSPDLLQGIDVPGYVADARRP